MNSKYEQMADDFLIAVRSTIEIKFLKNGPHFDDDKDCRDIYEITIKRGHRMYKFNFGQSIAKSSGFKDTKTGRIYTSNGKGVNCNYTITDRGLRDFCKPFKGTPPTNYDILACLTKYNPGTFDDFCNEFAYDTDSKKAEKTYRAVVDEYLNICALFNGQELDLLIEIN